MTTMKCIRAISLPIGMALLVLGSTAAPAHAQGFLSPFVGYDFGGDASCPHIDNCQDKRLNAGVGFGTMGSVFGFEEEIADARSFFGKAPNISSSVFTATSNLLIAPTFGPVRPYAVGGLGLIKTHVEFRADSLFTSTNNNLGWDLGGGLMGFVGSHVGVRAEVRYFHTFRDLKALGFTLSHAKLDYGRASAGVVFKF